MVDSIYCKYTCAWHRQQSSCNAEAVSRLMYNIPIDRVCVFNCEAIGVINDAVGGVEVTIENDFTDESEEVLEPEFYKGNTLKLTGEQAVTFIRERDCTIFKQSCKHSQIKA